MNETCIIGYGTLGRKVFEAISLKEKIKIYNRTKDKLRNVKKIKNLIILMIYLQKVK